MSIIDYYKKQEFIEKSKCIFGKDTFSYDKLPEKVDTSVRVELICNKCGNMTNRTYRQHIAEFNNFLGCRTCKFKYHNYDPKDTEEEKERKVSEIKKELEVIKEKYKKICEEEKGKIINAKKGCEKNYVTVLKGEYDDIIKYVEENISPEFTIEKNVIYLIVKNTLEYDALHKNRESKLIKSH